jgi:cytosine/adenosine deaminase-related metal-dependent hydrolase
MASLKIDSARYVVTVDPQRRIVRDASILIDNGRITRVGKAASWPAPRPIG